MAKTRAQRKAERRKREAQAGQGGSGQTSQARGQRRTQMPETADVIEAELAEHGADLEALKRGGDAAEVPEAAEAPPTPGSSSQSPVGFGEVVEVPDAPAPSRADVEAPGEDKISRRARKAEEKERKQRAKDFERRQRQTAEAQTERQRGPVIGFLVSCWAELRRVQWPDRDTLIQASGVTLLFIAVASAYLGALDAIFNWIVQRIL